MNATTRTLMLLIALTASSAHATLVGDTFSWSFDADAAGNLAGGTTTVIDPGIEAVWVHPLFSTVFSADLAADTLTLSYDSGNFNSASTWTFVDLNFVPPTDPAIFSVSQIGGNPVNDILFTENSIQVFLPPVVGPAEFVFEIAPIPEPSSLLLLALGCAGLRKRKR